MRHKTNGIGQPRITNKEDAMGADLMRRIFLFLVLAALALLAALEVSFARAGDPTGRTEAPWISPLRDMDAALTRADMASAATARHKAYLAAVASRRWEGFLAVGDATLRLREVEPNARALEAEVRRAYLSALIRARSAHSLEGVLQATEAFARLGDHETVRQGIRIARDLAGPDETAQNRVRAFAERWAVHDLSSRALDPQLTPGRAL